MDPDPHYIDANLQPIGTRSQNEKFMVTHKWVGAGYGIGTGTTTFCLNGSGTIMHTGSRSESGFGTRIHKMQYKSKQISN
jgi:hypothetical protein